MVVSVLAYSCSPVLVLFLDPILSIRLDELGIHENEVALAFGLIGFTYSIGSIIAGILSEKYSKRGLVLASFICCSVSIYISGGLYMT